MRSSTYPSERRLRRTFADVLSTILATATASGAVALTACGGSTSNPGEPTPTPQNPQPQFVSICSKDIGSLPHGLKASPPLDGALYRTEKAFPSVDGPPNPGGVNFNPAPEDGDGWTASNGTTTGELCRTASNRQACLDKVKGFRVLPGAIDVCEAQYPDGAYSGMACATTYLLYTRGDEIGVARTKAETLALIGTIDTMEELLWVAEQTSLKRSCSNSKISDSQYRTTGDGGFDVVLLDEENCGPATFRVTVHVDAAGNLTELSREDLKMKPSCAVAGRRPEGLSTCDRGSDDVNAVGAYFASMAHLEAASVVAFRRLHRQLASFGAPAPLLTRVRSAIRDEIRHTRATRALANDYGVTPLPPRIAPLDLDAGAASLFEIARENAREGCVRETFGALVAHLQSARAGDADVRAAMAAVADDETEHAALSWDIAAWAETQLDPHERDALATERREAVAALARELAAPVDERVRVTSGIPDAREALRMLEGLETIFLAA